MTRVTVTRTSEHGGIGTIALHCNFHKNKQCIPGYVFPFLLSRTLKREGIINKSTVVRGTSERKVSV